MLHILILGVIIFLSSTPVGMAKGSIPEEVRADFFVAGDDDEKGVGEAALLNNDEAAFFEAEGSESLESQTEVERQTKRLQKRNLGKKCFISKCRTITGLSAKVLSKGEARHPRTQDARQERRAVIRFLQLAALI